MPSHAIACHLYEPDGTPLGAATWLLDDAPAPPAPPEPGRGAVVLTALDRPGRVVERCLLGPARTVWLHLRDGTLLAARVERVFFDPARGRSCAVRLLPRPRPAAGAPAELAARWRAYIRATEARFAREAAARGEPLARHSAAELAAAARLAAAAGVAPPALPDGA